MLRLYIVFLFCISLVAAKGVEYQKQNSWINRINIDLLICEVCEKKGGLTIYNKDMLECSYCEYLSRISDCKIQLYSISICQEIKLSAEGTKI